MSSWFRGRNIGHATAHRTDHANVGAARVGVHREQLVTRPLQVSPSLQVAAALRRARRLANRTPRLFPGVRPGQPLSRKAFGDQLARRGVKVGPARTTALVALAAELPPPVLAELPDVHIHTALKWTHHAQRDGSAYRTARVTDRDGGG